MFRSLSAAIGIISTPRQPEWADSWVRWAEFELQPIIVFARLQTFDSGRPEELARCEARFEHVEPAFGPPVDVGELLVGHSTCQKLKHSACRHPDPLPVRRIATFHTVGDA
jgi:hypothetical protein